MSRAVFLDRTTPFDVEPRQEIWGCTDAAGWSRHGVDCKPGMYRCACIVPIWRIKAFFQIPDVANVDAVMDDFGTLVPVRGAA